MEPIENESDGLCSECEGPLNEDGECDACKEQYVCEHCGIILEYDGEVCPLCESEPEEDTE